MRSIIILKSNDLNNQLLNTFQSSAHLVSGALQPALCDDDALPGKQLLHQLVAGLLDGRGQVHHLVGDADFVDQSLGEDVK